jgi:hypothetical protein
MGISRIGLTLVVGLLAATGCAADRPGEGDDDVSGTDGGPTDIDGGPQGQCTGTLLCVGADVYTCDEGQIGDLVTACPNGCANGSCVGGTPEGCDESTQLIYVVDKDYNLLAFDPRQDANTFMLIGQLDCPAGTSWPLLDNPATPFSMSIDRTGRAWVLYTSGEIFFVDTSNASCTPSTFTKGAQGFQLFGMGFVSDAAGSDAETLFIAGGDASIAAGLPGATFLGKVAPSTMAVTKMDEVTRGELTGNGAGELWTYMPQYGFPFPAPTVAKLDKATGAVAKTYTLPGSGALVDAFAFAHYGGRYYVFETAATSRVLRLDPAGNNGAGKVDVVVPDSPYEIVGAGVSTCAPIDVE